MQSAIVNQYPHLAESAKNKKDFHAHKQNIDHL